MSEPTAAQEAEMEDRRLDGQIEDWYQAKDDERRGMVPPPEEFEEAELDRQMRAKEDREAMEEADYNHRWRNR